MPTTDIRLQDQLAIERQLYTFFVSLDERAFDTMASVMTEDGVWRRGGVDLAGRAGLLAVMSERPADRHSRHVLANMIVDFEADDRAKAVFYSTAWVHIGELSTAHAPMDVPSSIGVYTAQFVRTNGRWEMSRLSSKPAFKRVAGGKSPS